VKGVLPALFMPPFEVIFRFSSFDSMLWWVKSGTSFDLPYPYKINIARNGNRSSDRAYHFFGGIPVTGLIGALFALFFRITED
jgi:hypothetical protein